MGKKFFIKTFGCQMNVHDSMRMANLLKKADFQEVDDIEQSDIIIFNTCSVRENARNKVLSEVGSIQKKLVKKDMDQFIIAVGGCVGSQEGENLLKGNRNISIVFGPDQISRLPEIINKHIKMRKKIVDVNFDDKPFGYSLDEYQERHDDELTPRGTGFISIMKGCNNFCSFCIVPYARGREKSRKIYDILKETETLIANGVNEIVLLGQNVNSFGNDTGERFEDLLKNIDGLDVKRLRFLTAHPKDITDECIDLFFSLKSVCKHLHLPVQSGSSNILKRMNRKYDLDHYLSIINKFRKYDKDFAFGTDMIVGFPGESDEDFNETLALVQEVKFENMFSFKYSPRPGTKSYEMNDDVSQSIKEKRLSKLNKLYLELRSNKAKKLLGETWEILVETESKYSKGFVGGRSREARYVNFEAPRSEIGKFLNVKITGLSNLTYKGKIINNQND